MVGFLFMAGFSSLKQNTLTHYSQTQMDKQSLATGMSRSGSEEGLGYGPCRTSKEPAMFAGCLQDLFSQQKLIIITFILVGEEGGRHAFGKRPEVKSRHASGKATLKVTFAVWGSASQHVT